MIFIIHKRWDNFAYLSTCLTHLESYMQVSVDSLVKRAYDNWHQVVEYDGKVLHALTGNKKVARASPAPVADHNHAVMDHHFCIYSE